jgi:hypothetical protein
MPSTKTRAVQFMSKYAQHRLIMVPKDYNWQHGRVQGETPGHTIEFEQGRYTTDDPAEIEFLRTKVDGATIYEMSPVVPDPAALLAELATASADRTREIQSAELEGWERPVVLETCERKLASMGGRPRKEQN